MLFIAPPSCCRCDFDIGNQPPRPTPIAGPLLRSQIDVSHSAAWRNASLQYPARRRLSVMISGGGQRVSHLLFVVAIPRREG
jgi:hypothetical protein